jgi:hypothetical protein
MKLNEFADRNIYISTDADTENLVEQIESIWPARIEDDDAPSLNRPRKRPQNDRAKLLGAR